MRIPSVSPVLAAALLIVPVRGQGPDNPDPGSNLLTSFTLKQGVPAGSPNDEAWKLPGRDSYVMTPDRTGRITITPSITHTFSADPIIKLFDADGVLIYQYPASGAAYNVPDLKFNDYMHLVVFAPDGTPIANKSIVTGGGGPSDGPGFSGGTSSSLLEIPPITYSTPVPGKNGEGDAGEDYGSCSSCQSCDLTNGKDSAEISADGTDGQVMATQPAGTSKQGDSETQLGAQVDPTEGIQQEDIKVNGTGDATVSRDSANNDRITSVATGTAYTKVESTTVGGDSAVKLSQWRSAALATSNPGNPDRVVTYVNSDPNEITRTNALTGGATVTTVWKYDSTTSKWEYTEADLRKKELTLETSGDPTIRIERHKLYERNAAATSWVLVSDVRKTFTKFSFAWKKTKVEVFGTSSLATNPLVTKWEYWGTSDVTGVGSSTNGRTLLKSVTYPDGAVEEHNYSASGSGGTAEYVHTINKSFQGATPGAMTEVQTTTGNGDSSDKQVKVGADITSESTTTWSGNNVTVQQSTGPSAFEEQTSTVTTFGSDFGGRPTASAMSDETGTVSSYSRSGSGASEVKVTTSAFGELSGGVIVSGTTSTATTNSDGVVVLKTSQDITTGIYLEKSSIPTGEQDNFGRPERIDYFLNGTTPAFWETAEYTCCGLSKHTDKFGVVTHYAYDGLKRPTRVNRLGVTRHTVYDHMLIRSYRYAETVSGGNFTGTAATQYELSRSFRDLSGTIRYSFSRSPQTGFMILDSTVTALFRNPAGSTPNPYSLPAGIGRRVTTVLPITTDDGGVTPSETTDYYLDGRVYQTTGNLSPDVRYSYAVGALNYKGDSAPDGYGSSTTTTVLDNSGNPMESSTTYTDRAGKTFATVSAWGGLTEYFYTDERLTKVVDADGVTRLYGYNTKGERVLDVLELDPVTSSNYGVVTYGSDQVSFSETRATTRGTTPVLRTTTKVWKPGAGAGAGTVVSYRDVTPDGLSSWQDTFPTAGSGYGTSSSTLDLGTQQDAIWSVTSVSADGVISRDYHSAGRLVASTLWASGSTLPASAPANITSVSDAGFISGTAYGYDSIGRPTTSTDSRTGATITTYGPGTDVVRDEVSSVKDPGNRTTSFTYDHRGRRKTVNLPDSLSSTGGNLTNVTTTNHFIDGSVKLVDGGQTYKTGYTYDYAGRMKTLVTYGDSTATTTWNYSASTGQLTSKSYPDGPDVDTNPDAGPTYHYTVAGRLKKRIWARGNTTRYDFDDGGRMIHTRYFAASTAQGTVDTAATGDDPVTADSSFDYDALGRLEEAANDHSTIDYGYHSDLLTLATETIAIDPDGPNTPPGSGPRAAVTRTFERGRDSLLRPDGYLFKNGTTVEADVAYAYHASHGRLDEVSGVHAGAAREFNWTYEPEAYGLPAAVTGPQHVVTMNWKADRDVLHNRANSERYDDNGVISSYEYAVNDIGQRTGVTLGGDQFSVTGIAWGYDSMGQVKTADRGGVSTNLGDRGYKWDGIGNRYRSSKNSTDPDTATGSDLSVYRVATGASSAAGASALNQYGRVEIDGTTGVDQAYDADGNQETGRYPSTATGTRYWDGENRMYRTTVGSTDTSYAYDPFGRRVAKYQGSDTDMTGRIYFYDGWNAAAECAIGASTYPLDRTYTWGPDLSGSMQGAGGVGGLLAVEIETGTDAGVYYPTFDGNGNVSEYLDSGGQAVAHFEYDPFGDLVLANGDKFALFNYRFSTKPLDNETGYYYYGFRYYDPVTGRWPSRDPIDERGGVNLYGFVGNDGVGRWDFLGMDFVIIAGGPSLSRDNPDGNLATPDRHDQYAFNFYNIAKNAAIEIAGKCKDPFQASGCCCKVIMLIYQPGYDNRQAWDAKFHHVVYPTITTRSAADMGATPCLEVKMVKSSKEILDFLKSYAAGCISQVEYFGHSSADDVMPEYGSREGENDGSKTGIAKSSDSFTNEQLAEAMGGGRSRKECIVKHHGCHGAKCAKTLHDALNIKTTGWTGKTLYTNSKNAGVTSPNGSGVLEENNP